LQELKSSASNKIAEKIKILLSLKNREIPEEMKGQI